MGHDQIVLRHADSIARAIRVSNAQSNSHGIAIRESHFGESQRLTGA
jgi:hypothetical protein